MPALNGLPSWFKEARKTPCPLHSNGRGRTHARGCVDRSLDNITAFTKRLIAMDEGLSKAGRGALQSIEPAARLFGLLTIALAAAITVSSIVLGLIILATALLALGSRVGLIELVKRTAPSAVFAFIMMTPAFLSFIFPGAETLPMGPSAYKTALTSSQAGAGSVFFFVARVSAVVSLAGLLSLTTTPGALFNGLARLKVPPLFVATLFITFRYLFILLTIAEDAALARKSRTIGRTNTADARRWFASRAALILKKAMATAEEVGLSMASRGFTGIFKTFTGAPLVGRDYLWIGFSLFVFFVSLGF